MATSTQPRPRALAALLTVALVGALLVGAPGPADAVTTPVTWQRIGPIGELSAAERTAVAVDAQHVWWLERRATDADATAWVVVEHDRATGAQTVVATLSTASDLRDVVLVPGVVAWTDTTDSTLTLHDFGRGAAPVEIPLDGGSGFPPASDGDTLVYGTLDSSDFERKIYARDLVSGTTSTIAPGVPNSVAVDGDVIVWSAGSAQFGGSVSLWTGGSVETIYEWSTSAGYVQTLDAHAGVIAIVTGNGADPAELASCTVPCASGFTDVTSGYDGRAQHLELTTGAAVVYTGTLSGAGALDTAPELRTIDLSTGAVAARRLGDAAIDLAVEGADVVALTSANTTIGAWRPVFELVGAVDDPTSAPLRQLAGAGSGPTVPVSDLGGGDLRGDRWVLAAGSQGAIDGGTARIVTSELGSGALTTLSPLQKPVEGPPVLTPDSDVVYADCCVSADNPGLARVPVTGGEVSRVQLNYYSPFYGGTTARSDYVCPGYSEEAICSLTASGTAIRDAGDAIGQVVSTPDATFVLTLGWSGDPRLLAFAPGGPTDTIEMDSALSFGPIAADGTSVVYYAANSLWRGQADLTCSPTCEELNDRTDLGNLSPEAITVEGDRVLVYGHRETGGGEFGSTSETGLFVIEGTDAPVQLDVPNDARVYDVELSGSRAMIVTEDGSAWVTDLDGGALPSPDATAPGPVTGLSGSSVSDGVELTWTNPTDDDVASIRVVRTTGTAATGPYDPDGALVYVGPGEKAWDLGVPVGTDQIYTVFAVDGAGNVSDGTSVTISVTAVESPDADGDGWGDDSDNCPVHENAVQSDLDGDGLGDACDPDTGGDTGGGGGGGGDCNGDEVVENAEAHQAVTTVGSGGTRFEDPFGVTVVPTAPGRVSIQECGTAGAVAPPDIALLTRAIIEAPAAASEQDPIEITFALHDDVVPAGPSNINVYRDGLWVPPCTPPDEGPLELPCVSAKGGDVNGTPTFTVLTMAASEWSFGVPYAGRLAGSNRYATAADIALSHDRKVRDVYIATGRNYPDALAAAAVAGFGGHAVLLTAPDSLPAPTIAALQQLQPENIYVVGGFAAISGDVGGQLRSYAPNVDRIAGGNRYETAAKLAGAFTPPRPVVYIATGQNFPDALAATAPAVVDGGPILLVKRDSIPDATIEMLQHLKPSVIVIVGGDGVVSGEVAFQLQSYADTVGRLSGGNRYETAVNASAGRFGAGAEVVYVATGRNFPDALAGGGPAGASGGPLLLVPSTGDVPEAVSREITRLGAERVVVLGGAGAVSQGILNQLESLVRPG